jgi:hypothetical protein
MFSGHKNINLLIVPPMTSKFMSDIYRRHKKLYRRQKIITRHIHCGRVPCPPPPPPATRSHRHCTQTFPQTSRHPSRIMSPRIPMILLQSPGIAHLGMSYLSPYQSSPQGRMSAGMTSFFHINTPQPLLPEGMFLLGS